MIPAANGEEALTLVAQRQPDAVVLDISLGSEPNGLEVCRRIREWSSVPIVMLSVKNEDKAKIAALDTHRAILNQVWGTNYGEMSHSVRVFVNQLRKKLRENPSRNIRYILNEPGVG